MYSSFIFIPSIFLFILLVPVVPLRLDHLGKNNEQFVQKPDPNIIWPNRTVPYEISAKFSDDYKVKIQVAIDEFNQKTCLNWIPRNGQVKYALFESVPTSPECGAWADHCDKEGELKMNFITRPEGECPVFPGAILHEMGHLACLGHENERVDRDNFVRPMKPECNIGPKNWDSDHLYDYLSVMHYFCNELTCIEPSRGGVPICGQMDESQVPALTAGDAEKINDIFDCPGCLSYRFRFPNLISPVEAFDAGTDTETPFICRGYADGNIYSGKASASLDSCWISYDGHVFRLFSGFEVLTNPANVNLTWVKGNGIIPIGAIPAGRTKWNDPVYIARCQLSIDGLAVLITGRILAQNPREAFVPYGNSEYTCTDFEILICA